MILVTGGTGLIGSQLLADLARAGHRVRALKRDHSSMALLQRTFGDQFPGFIEWVPGDINDIESLEDAMEGIREVYHCAGLVSFLSSDYRRQMKINL